MFSPLRSFNKVKPKKSINWFTIGILSAAFVTMSGLRLLIGNNTKPIARSVR